MTVQLLHLLSDCCVAGIGPALPFDPNTVTVSRFQILKVARAVDIRLVILPGYMDVAEADLRQGSLN